jgi:hypothetical protein
MEQDAFTARIPTTLAAAVRRLKFANPSDRKIAIKALDDPEPPTKGTISWLAGLVARKGVRFDSENDEHKGPHTWPPP